jgi:hypothetical protein
MSDRFVLVSRGGKGAEKEAEKEAEKHPEKGTGCFVAGVLCEVLTF